MRLRVPLLLFIVGLGVVADEARASDQEVRHAATQHHLTERVHFMVMIRGGSEQKIGARNAQKDRLTQ